jgi:hypothetical protein
VGNAAPYRFDELGWLQFDRLCAALLDLDADVSDARDFGRVGLVPDGVVPPAVTARLAAPTLVVVAWLPPVGRWSGRRRLRRLVAAELERAPRASVGSLLLVTNTEEPIDGVPVPVVRVGPARLGQLLDADSQLRLRVPSVLGIRELDGVIAQKVAVRSTADVAAAAELSRVFVPTRAYARALDVLEHRHFAVLAGPPEMGKTAIARMVAFARLTTGWEAHECIRPEQLWSVFARDRPQIFIADDAFGSTEYRPDAAERWSLELDRVLRAMDDRHWLIWTSRPAPLKAGLRRIHREHGLERFPQPAEVQVDAAALGVDEKALILFRHAKAAALRQPAVELVRTHGWTIVSHPHFTPERIRRFVRERLGELASRRAAERELREAVATEIREPTGAMAASFAALPSEHRAVLVALLDAPPGPVPERHLAAAVRRHSEGGFSRPPADVLDRLTDHFVRVVPAAGVAWVHPSWRDLVIAELAEAAVARRRFLERCGVDGVLLALSVAGGAAGERVLPLLRDDGDWDTLIARVGEIAAGLDDASAIRLLTSLSAAFDADLPERARAEVIAVAALALERVAAAWDDMHVTLGVGALEAWFALADRLPEQRSAPTVVRTWIELLPIAPVDPRSREALVRLEEWLALAEVLGAFAPDQLERFGFPERQDQLLAAFVAAATQAPDEAEELVAQILNRIRRVAPAYAPAAARATRALSAKDDPWFEVRFETHPRRPEPAPFDRDLVERVLRDLG